METPLLATPELVLPIQKDEKTETRRMRGLEWVNREPDNWSLRDLVDGVARFESLNGTPHQITCPYGWKGDKLWIRENWFAGKGYDDMPSRSIPAVIAKVGYMADGEKPDWAGKTRPSIHMPRWLSRIELDIMEITCERLRNITIAGVKAEGAGKDVREMWLFGEDAEGRLKIYRNSFCRLWVKINDQESWNLNPWVWVIKFKRCRT